MAHSPQVRRILSWYEADCAGTRANLVRMLNAGRLAGSGKLLFLPVERGVTRGPALAFQPNPAAYDPRYLIELAIAGHCSAFAAPGGLLEAVAADYAGEIPLVLMLNLADSLYAAADPHPPALSTLDTAVRLGCGGIGYLLHPGSAYRNPMYEQLAAVTAAAKQRGLVVVVWSYPRGNRLTHAGETAMDTTAYGLHIAAQLGAHIIITRPCHAGLENPGFNYGRAGIATDTLADRTRHLADAAFDGRRLVLYSAGPAHTREQLLDEVRHLADGGADGIAIGRHSWQRPRDVALALMQTMQRMLGAAARRPSAGSRSPGSA